MPKRSGFLSQLAYGKPVYAKDHPDFFEDFGITVLMLSDTQIDSHRIYAAMPDEIAKNTPPHIMKFKKGADQGEYGKTKKNAKKTAVWGLTPASLYLNTSGNQVSPMVKRTVGYRVFSNVRKGLFRTFKLVDMSFRIPAMAFATLQLIFERGGWRLQTFYKSIDNPVLKFLAFVIIGSIGLAMNITGAIVFRMAVFLSKIAAEAVRFPFAVMGGVVGLLFGSVVAAIAGVAKLFGKADSVKPWYNSLIQGMLDGIRPFAPEAANSILAFYLKTGRNFDGSLSMKIRLPFQEIESKDTAKTIDLPWMSIGLFVLSVAIIIALSVASFGIGALGGVPVIPYLFHATGLASHALTASGTLGPMLSKVTMVAMGLMGIGFIQSLTVGIARGWSAFRNDCLEVYKSASTVIGEAFNSITNSITARFREWRTARALASMNNKNADMALEDLATLAQDPPVVQNNPLYVPVGTNPIYVTPTNTRDRRNATTNQHLSAVSAMVSLGALASLSQSRTSSQSSVAHEPATDSGQQNVQQLQSNLQQHAHNVHDLAQNNNDNNNDATGNPATPPSPNSRGRG